MPSYCTRDCKLRCTHCSWCCFLRPGILSFASTTGALQTSAARFGSKEEDFYETSYRELDRRGVVRAPVRRLRLRESSSNTRHQDDLYAVSRHRQRHDLRNRGADWRG